MTSHLLADDAPPTKAVAKTTRSRRLATVARLVTAAVAVAGMAAAWHWRTHPEALPGGGNGMGVELRAGDTSYIGVTDPYPGKGPSITINSASARIVENTAAADIQFFVCTLAPDPTDGGSIGIVDATSFSLMCPNPEPVVPGTELNVGAAQPEQLVAAITVNRPGKLRTRGVDLSYAHGWQNGTQAISAALSIDSK